MQGVPRVPLLPLLAIALLVSACGSDDRPATDVAGPSRHAAGDQGEQRATQRASPTPEPTPASPSSTPARPERTGKPGKGKTAPLLPMERASLGAHLLAVERMPTLTDDFVWTVVEDGAEDLQSVGACQKTSLESIGAVGALRRAFAPADGTDQDAAATQVVARFADDKSAWRAHEVLRSWREDCEERLDYARKDVGPLRTVTVRVGTGDNYRTAYGPRSEERTRIAGFGIVRTGSFLTIVEVTTPEADYPADRDPARVAVRRIARTFA